MNFYISSGLNNIDQVRRAAGLLKDNGWTHTCDWTNFDLASEDNQDALRSIGEREYEGIKAADVVIVIAPRGRGTHVELGMAIALSKSVYICHVDDSYFRYDDNTCAFYWLPGVRRLVGEIDAVIEAIVREYRQGQFSNKWIRQIVRLQHEDGSWGHFHTLSAPRKEQPMTTEQALRRLRILGLTKKDEPIARALTYMEHNLNNPNPTVFHEKTHDSKTYGDLMLATWIRLFDPDNASARITAEKWANVITRAFQSGEYVHSDYVSAYEAEFAKLNPKAGCLANFVVFYQMALLPGMLSPHIESAMLDYVLAHPGGMYYIYEDALNTLPTQLASRKGSRYVSAMEVLAAYSLAPQKLGFVADWLESQQDENGQWDMSPVVKDGIHFPLSESWRRAKDRKRDCTVRITNLLSKLRGE